MLHFLSAFAFLFLSGCISPSHPAEEIHLVDVVEGKVIKIVDGDTYDVLLSGNTQIRIRMYGIDAPESRMPFYQKSKDLLAELCFGKTVKIEKTGTDRNGRWIAKTYTADQIEIGKQMILGGMAWHFKRYSTDKDLAEAELKAKKEKRGLWADPNPVAPWDWRKAKRKQSN